MDNQAPEPPPTPYNCTKWITTCITTKWTQNKVFWSFIWYIEMYIVFVLALNVLLDMMRMTSLDQVAFNFV